MRELPDDVLFLVFNHLDILDILHATEAFDAFQQPAVWWFRRFHAHKIIEINGRYFPHLGPDEVYHIHQKQGIIKIRSYQMTLKVLNTFGSAIENLQIDYKNIRRDELTQIQRIIDEKCINNLKYFGIRDSPMYQIDVIPWTFPNVETVSLKSLQFRGDAGLNESFPNMRSLDLSDFLYENGKPVDKHFPRLNEIRIDFGDRNPHIICLNETHIERMIQRNPQIKSAAFRNPSQDFLRFLHNNLPNLEALEVNDERKEIFSQYNDAIFFGSVKKFTLHMDHQFFKRPQHSSLTFGDNLEEFKLVLCCMSFRPIWIKFMERFANVPYYSIEFPRRCEEYPDLSDLKVSNVREMRLKYIDLGVFRNIFNKIKHQQQLETIHVIGLEQSEYRAIRDELSAEWTVNVSGNRNWDDKIDVVLSKM